MQHNSYIPMQMMLLNIIIIIIYDERLTMSIILLLITGLSSWTQASAPESALPLSESTRI